MPSSKSQDEDVNHLPDRRDKGDDEGRERIGMVGNFGYYF